MTTGPYSYPTTTVLPSLLGPWSEPTTTDLAAEIEPVTEWFICYGGDLIPARVSATLPS